MKISKIIFFICLVNLINAQTKTNIIYNFEDGKISENYQLINSECEIINTNNNYSLIIKTKKSSRITGISFNKKSNSLWDFSDFAKLLVDVTNYSEEPITVWLSIKGFLKSYSNKIVECLVPAAATIKSGANEFISLNIYASGKKLDNNQEIIAGRGVPIGSGDLNPTRIKQISVFIKKPVKIYKFGIDNIRLEGKVEIVEATQFFPFIDSLGQYIHSDWPGKTASLDELKTFAVSEEEELRAERISNNLDEYGGWTKGEKLKATGYFYTKKINNKWWLINPLGNLFFSLGINGVGTTAPTPIDNRESYFENLPSKTGKFSECWSSGSWAPHGYYKNHTPYNTFDFLKANLIRKYGNNWQAKYREITYLRFNAWGINTLGNWSENYMYNSDSGSKIPYVVSGSSTNAKPIEGSSGWWRKFPDPFDSSFRESVRKSLVEYRNSAVNDPYCIGFFVDNEQSWGDEITLAISTIKSPETQVAKVVFVDGLKNKYEIIEKLNSSWKTKYVSWEELLLSKSVPDTSFENVKNDLTNFYSKLSKEYFKICREEVKRIAPNQMYLGCRFSEEMMENETLQILSQEYCDVITYNIYNLLPVGIIDKIDRPVMIGEFHFGALDRGMFHTGLWFAKNQDERAELYENYVLYALTHPLIVGTHWFQYPAEPTTGRSDGENFQIGFTDICDKPYPELIKAVKKISKKMYKTRFVL